MSLISLQNVDFDFGREPILRGASLTLLEGERYALIGQNGTGKSTLLNLLAGELEAHGGERRPRAGCACGCCGSPPRSPPAPTRP
jgi:ATPase subunit of ABC transporter with duplicated ATPase domains